jgi:hypothetical protein
MSIFRSALLSYNWSVSLFFLRAARSHPEVLLNSKKKNYLFETICRFPAYAPIFFFFLTPKIGSIEDTAVFGKLKDFERAERKENAIMLNIGGPITFANFDDILEKLRRKLKHIPRTAPIVVSEA